MICQTQEVHPWSDQCGQADRLFEDWDCGEGLQVIGHGPWQATTDGALRKDVLIGPFTPAHDNDMQAISLIARITPEGATLETLHN